MTHEWIARAVREDDARDNHRTYEGVLQIASPVSLARLAPLLVAILAVIPDARAMAVDDDEREQGWILVDRPVP